MLKPNMVKQSTVIFFVALLLFCGVDISISVTANAAATESQKWECAIDLHQGDNGTLSLNRDGERINGMLNIRRNDSIFENEVSGRWSNNEINLKRLIDDSRNDSMIGVVVSLGTKKVNMGGRYSAEYQGVWSANCDLVGTSNGSTGSADGTEDTSPIEPSTSAGVIPNRPNTADRIKFSARASHPDGIESVSFFVGNKKIHTCDTEVCDYNYGPLSKGKYSWFVEAVSKSGIKNSKRQNEFVVSASASKGSCLIEGIATGTAAELSGIYLVKLYGPDGNTLKASQEFQDGRYQFTGLPEGRYTLTVDTRADREVLVTPATATATCSAQSKVIVNFDFR